MGLGKKMSVLCEPKPPTQSQILDEKEKAEAQAEKEKAKEK